VNARSSSQAAFSTYRLDEDGFQVAERPLVSAEALAAVLPSVDAVLHGEYATGVPPYATSGGPEPWPTFVEVAMAHLCDDAIWDFVHEPGLAAWIAEVTGEEWLKVWNVQLMWKAPHSGTVGQVGWHTDDKYLRKIFAGTNYNLWIALRDVPAERGPVRFVAGSHRWGVDIDTSFFDPNVDAQEEKIRALVGRDWREVASPLQAGQATLHVRNTLHGSGANTTDEPRLSMLLSVLGRDAEPVMDSYYMQNLDNPRMCPVILG